MTRAREYGDLYRNNKYWLWIWWGNGQFVTYKGKKLNQIDWEYSSIIRRIIEWMQNRNDANPYYTAEAQIAAVRRWLREQQMVWDGRWLTSKWSKEKFNKEMAFLDSLNPKDFKVQDEKRNLYEVDVPEVRKTDTPTKTNYLEEWDIVDNDAYKIINDKLFKETGNKMQRWSSKVDGRTMYSRLSEALWGDKQASEFLRDMWYDGIHYIGKEDWSSYVLFNDNAPQIQKYIKYKKNVNWLAKKSNWLQRNEKSDIRYKLDNRWFTETRNLITEDLDEMKTRGTSVLKTFDKSNWEDTLKNLKKKIKSDMWINVLDGVRIRKSDLSHSYNHAYDTELWYWTSITKEKFERVPDVLENYDTITRKGNTYTLEKDYWKDRYNLVVEIVPLRNGKYQLSLKTFYINDAQWRANFNLDRKNKDVRNIRLQAKRQYWDRFGL